MYIILNEFVLTNEVRKVIRKCLTEFVDVLNTIFVLKLWSIQPVKYTQIIRCKYYSEFVNRCNFP